MSSCVFGITKMPKKPMRDASGRFVKGPFQGQTPEPVQGHSGVPSQDHPKRPFSGPTGDVSASEASRAPSAASMFSRADELSDSDDEAVLLDLGLVDAEEVRQARKRAYLRQGSGESSDSTESKAKAGKKKSKANKPSDPAVVDTHDVGLADAKRQLDLARRSQIQQDLEEKVAAKERQALAARAKAGYGASRVVYADHSLAELERMALEDKEEIAEVASKSSNLKGTFQKSLKCRAASLHGIVQELVQRTATDETRQLQAKVDRLQAEVSQLHLKLAEATARPTQASQGVPVVEGPSSDNLADVLRKVVMEERAFTRACLAGIEDRLLPERRLRPPLAADGRALAPAPAVTPAPVSASAQAPKPSKGKGKGKTTKAAPQAPSTSRAGENEPTSAPAAPQRTQTEDDALLPSTTPSNQSWAEVVKRGWSKKRTVAAAPVPGPSSSSQSATGNGKGKGKGKKSAPKPSTAAPAAAKAPAGGRKLVPPKTAAVVVTLLPEATERGETYESVLKRARTNADPTKLGIGKVTCRRTQTGARIFEFPGANGSANADLFATKVREVVGGVAKVARPIKSVALEVTDLDDSVTKEEVVAAIAAAGGCDAAAVQGRTIRPGRGGLGAIRLECPIAAAKTILAKSRRLTVGFSSAVIRALEDKPLRCFKCFGIGHTRPMCPSSVDRADTCCRCGKEGHKAADCSATKAHCAVCAASGRPADHVMKGRNCHPPQKKGKAQAPAKPAAAVAVAEASVSETVDEGGAMSE